jgi:hypothetical protein
MGTPGFGTHDAATHLSDANERGAIMRARTTTTILILALVAVGAVADPNRRHGDQPTVPELLERAAVSYEDGRLGKALRQLERAQALIVREMDDPDVAVVPARSNAPEILMYLDFYRIHALGSDLDDDAAWSYLTDVLTMVAEVESFPDPPDRWRGKPVWTWVDGKVHQLESVSIGHWADGRIHQVGRYSIMYWADGRPHHIGGIDYRYHAGDQWPHCVGTVNVD